MGWAHQNTPLFTAIINQQQDRSNPDLTDVTQLKFSQFPPEKIILEYYDVEIFAV